MRQFSLEEKDVINLKLTVNVYCFKGFFLADKTNLSVFLDNLQVPNLKQFSYPLGLTMVCPVGDNVMCTIFNPTNLKCLMLPFQLIS